MLIQLPPNVHRIEIVHEEGLARIVLPGERPGSAPPFQNAAAPPAVRSPRLRLDRNTALLAALVAIAFTTGHVLHRQSPGAAATPTYEHAASTDGLMLERIPPGQDQHRVVRAAPAATDDFGLH